MDKINLKETTLLNNIKEKFPVFNNKINGKNLVYLDSAASAQKPEVVINSIKSTYESQYANVHRGIYYLSQVTDLRK